MTSYTIDFDDKFDAAIEAARAQNEPGKTAAEYLAICFEPVLMQIGRDYEPAVVTAKAALKVAEEAVRVKYEPVKEEVEA